MIPHDCKRTSGICTFCYPIAAGMGKNLTDELKQRVAQLEKERDEALATLRPLIRNDHATCFQKIEQLERDLAMAKEALEKITKDHKNEMSRLV